MRWDHRYLRSSAWTSVGRRMAANEGEGTTARRSLRRNRNIEIQQLSPRLCLAQTADIHARAALKSGLKIKEAAGRLARGQHLRGESAALDLPGVQRVLVANDLWRHARRPGQSGGTLGPVQV